MVTIASLSRRCAAPESGQALCALVALAVWPVWLYLARSYTTPGAEIAPAFVLGGTLFAASAVRWHAGERRGGRIPGAALVVLLVYAVAYPALPALARAFLGLTAFGLTLLALPGVGWRERSGLLPLLLLSAPSLDSLNFFAGGALRACSAAVAAASLNLSGAPALAEGAGFRIEGQFFSVDAPCSGVNGLWSGLVVAAALATYQRLSPLRTGCLIAASGAVCVLMNGWRASALVHLQRFPSFLSCDDIPLAHDEEELVVFAASAGAHEAVGLFVFAASLGLLLLISRGLARPAAPAAQHWTPALPSRGYAMAAVGVLVVAAAAPVSSWRRPSGTPAPSSHRFPGWPLAWRGIPLRRLPESQLEKRFAVMSADGRRLPVARFSLHPYPHKEILLRWVEHAGREVHPAEDCYRGSGYRVESRSPVQAAPPVLPGVSRVNHAPVLWREFSAERDGSAWHVRSLVISHTGHTYSDPAWWWWKVNGPGASDPGPWWVVTESYQKY